MKKYKVNGRGKARKINKMTGDEKLTISLHVLFDMNS